jgi:ABC-type glycerol-3-phosphate transport system substrate-binding protein
MDVIWTGEFANAGWVEEWTGRRKREATEGSFPGVIETASFEGRLYAAPSTPTRSCSGTAKTWSNSRRAPGTR